MQEERDRLIRFFDHKSFVTVHGDAALFIAQQYYKTAAVVKQYGSSPETTLPGLAAIFPKLPSTAVPRLASAIGQVQRSETPAAALHLQSSR